MNKRNLLFSVISIVLFAIIAMVYCSPLLSEKAIIQPDIVQHKGMAQELTKFNTKTGENTYWSNAAFGGMPTYQTGVQYNNDWIKAIDRTLRFLPRPADYIFILFVGFFILGTVLFKDWKYALLGSVFFALCSYFFIIIAAGHNAKVHAIAYFPPLVGGIILLYRGKYLFGFLITTLFLGLELAANHPQMTYYLFLAMVIFAVVEFIYHIKAKNLNTFFKASGLLLVSGLLAFGMNSGRYLSTFQYSKDTIRGKSEITLTDSNNSGLDKDYITAWSYGKLETLNLLIPNLMGGATGGNQDQLDNYSKAKRKISTQIGDASFADQIAQHQMYWGEQPGTSGPAYQGAIVVFLFFLGLFLVGGKFAKYKWWLLAATLLSILLAWGKNLQWFTDIFIDFVPFYDKFRAVSSILVIAELTMPLLAILCVYVFFKDESLSEERKKKILFYVGGGFVTFLLVLYLFGGNMLGFQSEYDTLIKDGIVSQFRQIQPEQIGIIEGMMNDLESAIQKDRIALFKADTLRSLFFVIVVLGVMLAYQFKHLKNQLVAILIIATFALIDGFVIGKRYLNDENFVPKEFVAVPYPTELTPKLQRAANKNRNIAEMAFKVPMNAKLKELKQSDDSYYRVYNSVLSTFNEANTSYFHSSFGGYHGAKLGRFQDIADLYFSNDRIADSLRTSGQSQKILDLFNVKYVIDGDLYEQNVNVIPNPGAFGNAWFVNEIYWVESANEEILALKDVDLEKKAIINQSDYPRAELFKDIGAFTDSLSTIQLVEYQPNKLVYNVNSDSAGFAVFSEIFYDKGWKAKLKKSGNEEEEIQILRVDYLLRGALLPKGEYQIEFYFEPQVIQTSNIITLTSNLLFLLIFIGGGFWFWKNRDV